MKKIKNMENRIKVLVGILSIILLVVGIFLVNNLLSNNTNELIASKDGIKTIDASEIYYDNYWSRSIITNVVDENVPVPEGLEYVSRNKGNRCCSKR